MLKRLNFSGLLCLLIALIAMTNVSAQNDKEGTVVTVLSFNILHGATTKGDFDLDKLAQVIKDSDADFVALQEVDFQTNRARKYDLTTELGWRTKMAPLYARAMHFDGGEYGEGVLSKTTFLTTRNVALPYTPGNEPRSAAEITTVLKSGDTITFIGTHLDHLKTDTDRVSQAYKINEVFKTNNYPTILAGDLNDVPGSKAISILEEFWHSSYKKEGVKFTYPSDDPQRKIDYVMYYPGNRWEVIEAEPVCDTIASDHCAYLVKLRLLEDKGSVE